MVQKDVTTEKHSENEQPNKKDKKQRVLLCEGAAEGNGAACFILREDLPIYPHEELVVGKDISDQEAQLLLNEKTWKFKEVTK
ncbi:hypothetical protein [Bacillus mobilis]|uniref:Uncharacterized protein n=1 Tax=Bacillus mobilis TaxID=2026190 RepID=A0A1Y5YWJ9_9BACI|nr:hypothetical protein [Bacillus mobilis]MCU5595102.1 hypothetical protein [Bacillus mobilis]MCU5737697.1 hypothetical protein [Bacillus mobilis]SMD66237.1 hypothetical protein BACERE00185_00113 [Bacillus mobilis]